MMQKEEADALAFAAVIGVIGAIIGLGKLLQSGEKITPRKMLGRAIVTAGLAVSAFSLMAWMPVPKIALVGVACLLASMGESAVERIIYNRLNGKK